MALRTSLRIFCFLLLVVSTSASAAEFKVATYNVWGLFRPIIKDVSRFRDIPKEFDKMDVDVLLVQETFTPVSRRATRVRTYPYYVRGPRVWGAFLSSGLQIISRWPIVRAESRGFAACEGVDCLAHKGAVIATIERPDGLKVDIMDTHFDAGAPLSINKAQVDTVALTIATYRGENSLVIGGDFNIIAGSKAYDYLMEKIPSQDTYKVWADSPDGQGYPEDVRAGFSFDSLLNSWLLAKPSHGRSRIDYILLQNKPSGTQLKVKSSRLIMNEMMKGRHLSDHFGLETTFEVIEKSLASRFQ